jgi:two-component system chemotaxis sensor kinase CheA
MDEELYQEFVTESEESITQLNNALLELESNPDDEEAIDDIFRQAHTLKGNFGAMGFENASTVAHAVEDLLDAVRQGEIEVTPERMDLVFDGMDEILDILHDIEEHGESGRDPTDLVTEIRAAAEPDGSGESGGAEADAPGEETADADGTDAGGDGATAEEARKTAVEVLDLDDPAVADADTLVHARITLDVGEMKGVDGGLFVNGLPEDLVVVGADPGLDAIEEGAFGDDFVLFVADTPVPELEPVLEDVWKVESVAVTDVSGVLDGDVAGSDDAGGDGPAGEDAAAEAVEAADDPADSGDEQTDGSPMSADDVGAATGTVPDSDVDPESASAAVDAVVAAYTDDGDPEDGPGGAASSSSETAAAPEIKKETAGGAAGAGDGTSESAGNGQTHAADEAADGPSASDGTAASDDGGSDDGDSESSDSDGDAKGSDGDEGADQSADDDGGESTPSISEVKSVRVDVDQLDDLHSLVEQLVTSRIKLRQAVESGGSTAGRDSLDELDKISSNLQDTVMDMRLIPLKKVFDKFPRLVRDLAREEDKRVDFSVEGEDIELDRTILDEISDPLMHVLRNAVDHGIESPAEREKAGKPRTGSVELRAEREHDTVVITVEDDGGGIDADAVRAKAAEKGIRPREELDELPDEEIYDYIFHPGFSTNDEITDVSGRGVGMDVVKTTVESLDGSVDVDSTLGEGTTVSIRLPVSVAIIKVLFVQADGREFGVPIKYIDEIAKDTRIQRVDGAEVVVHDDSIFPLIRLREALDLGSDSPDSGMTVRIRPSDRQIALRCDDVSRQEEVVVTPLQGPLKGTEGLSGTAVVGDGNVVPILDVNSLAIPDAGKQARRQWTPPEAEGAEAEGAAD